MTFISLFVLHIKEDDQEKLGNSDWEQIVDKGRLHQSLVIFS